MSQSVSIPHQKHCRKQYQRPAQKYQSQADELIPEKRTILRDSPCPVQRDFQRLKDSIRSEEQDQQRKQADLPVSPGGLPQGPCNVDVDAVMIVGKTLGNREKNRCTPASQ